MHYFISGRTQGVWFRKFVKEKAVSLKLSGWVKNSSDGRVEVYACGDKAQLEMLEQWLWKGPLLAKVTQVTQESAQWIEFPDFSIAF
ncbi:MAG: acylphosphatase [Gammaproteobacteria bacterium]|nr:acylphosphatase [Gammaproteobacteria bacterium]MBU1558845.1 acylphosphatase [Gammaproteobacteria bacterium]MBU1926772.1 acylphosphatase [Gammaproteobacteria bacterium]MBU2545784.1 acylphosphatase [Gammaproteobacteria bacterium]